MEDPKTKAADRGSSPTVREGSSEPVLVKVTLKQNHQDAGVNYKAGDTIEVDEPTAKWLRDNNVAS